MTSVSRLIRTFIPEHYTLSLTLERTKRQFNGVVAINGTTTTVTDTLRVHAKDLAIESAQVNGKSVDFHQEEFDELVLTTHALPAGKHVITIAYSGTITNDMNGIYPCYYEVEGEKKELIATQFESHFARQAFPCVDEPEAKATFDVILKTENDVTVLGNMPILRQHTESDKLVTIFDTTPRMSTYLLAWVVGDLQKTTATTKDGVEVGIWATKAHPAAALTFAADIAVRTIEFFDDYFGVPYPLPKSDHVALPDFSSGAMENWGLITYREIALLVDPAHTSLATKQSAATVIAHELAHQWFGNLVTMKWWNDLWLNESFANMMEYVAIDAIEPDWDIWLEQASGEVISALRRDAIDGVQSIQIDVNHPDEISTIFDPSIVYAKGGRLLRMLQAYVGDDDFRAGLKDYFETHQYTNTEADDLWASLAKSSGKDIAGFMHAWMTQSGYPVVTVSREGNSACLSQSQFFIGPHEPSSQTWPIPLHANQAEAPAILEAEETTFALPATSVLHLNQASTAHYITQYDQDSFALLVKQLPTMHPVNALSLLHEQILLAKSGRQSYAALLPLLPHFSNTTNEAVWAIVALAINELKRFVEYNEAAENSLRELVAELVKTQYERLGWQPLDGEDENDTKLRSTIISLAIYGRIPDATKHASDLFSSTPIEDIDPELRTTVLAYAVREELRPSLVEDLLEEYVQASNSELKDTIAAALTSTKNAAVISALAEKLTDSSVVRPQDFTHWYVWLLRNRFGRAYMWQWTQDNWQWIERTFKGDSHYDMFPRYIAGSLVTEDQLTEYTEFFTPLQSQLALARNISLGITELTGIVALIAKDTPVVTAALLEDK